MRKEKHKPFLWFSIYRATLTPRRHCTFSSLGLSKDVLFRLSVQSPLPVQVAAIPPALRELHINTTFSHTHLNIRGTRCLSLLAYGQRQNTGKHNIRLLKAFSLFLLAEPDARHLYFHCFTTYHIREKEGLQHLTFCTQSLAAGHWVLS